MANSNDNHPLKFIWKIENFSCIKREALHSPPFPWYSTTWEIKILFPDEIDCEHSFIVQLHQLPVKCEQFRCSFALLNSQGYPLVWKELGSFCRRDDAAHYSLTLINESELFGSKRNEFLPNDILTVQCHIWTQSILRRISDQDCLILTKPLMALTRISSHANQISFTWDVTDVTSKFESMDVSKREESITIDNSSFNITMSLCFYNGFHLALYFSDIHLKVTISAWDCSGKRIELLNSKELPPGLPGLDFFTEYQLMCYRSSFVCNDTLTLHFTFTGMLPGKTTFNGLVDKYEMVHGVLPSVNVMPNRLNNSNTASETFQGMYEEGFLSDFNLKVGDRLFPVHKAVLGIRSPVFRAMFTAEMKEKEDNCSVIKDVDGDTLHRMLQFIYSDKLDCDMDWENASSLYEAADKYDLETLKQRCSDILRSALCADSVLDVLTLADLHQDQELKSSAIEFISLDDHEIVGSERWNKFEEDNKELAFDTLRSLHLHSRNRNKKWCARGARGTSSTDK